MLSPVLSAPPRPPPPFPEPAFADRKALVLKALSRTDEAYAVLQWLQGHCEKTANVELAIR